MVAEPVSHFLRVGSHEVHVREWGAGRLETVVLWHGLARTSADFFPLADALGQHFRVLAPDTIGRGFSSWAEDPDDYGFAGYEALAAGITAVFGVNACMWVGTSMGGALGIRLAGGSFARRITHLVVNDIGPELPSAAVERIVRYVGSPPVEDRLSALEDRMRTMYRPYGHLSEADWKRMVLSSARRLPDGRWTLHYDARVVRQFECNGADYALWDAWRAIPCRTLVLHGQESDLLTTDILERMLAENGRASALSIPGVGHAPALNVSHQISAVREFLLAPP